MYNGMLAVILDERVSGLNYEEDVFYGRSGESWFSKVSDVKTLSLSSFSAHHHMEMQHASMLDKKIANFKLAYAIHSRVGRQEI